jgi:hypothetical protein
MIEGTPAGRAVLQAAVEGQVGAPVYLRLAEETVGGGDIVQRAAGAMHVASAALGVPVAVYVAGLPGGDGTPVHLALTVRYAAGAVALLGIGDAPAGDPERERSDGDGAGTAIGVSPTAPLSLLLLGDRGVVERYPGPAGGAPGGRPRDPLADPTLERFGAAIRRSLASGRQEPVAPAPDHEAGSSR